MNAGRAKAMTWGAPLVAALGLAALAVLFALELRSFRRTVGELALRDVETRARLIADGLRDALATGDFEVLRTSGERCREDGVRLSVFTDCSRPVGQFYDSVDRRTTERADGYLFSRVVPAGGFGVRLGVPLAHVYAPFRRARLGLVLAALVGAFGVLLVFVTTYRQRVRIRELARLERFRREFIADVSHEIKTPLAGILGCADLLGDEPGLRAQGTRLVGMLKDSANRLNALSASILDLARLEREGNVLRRVETDLSELVRGVVETLRPLADEHGVALAVRTDGGLVRLACDPQLVERALSNLIVNAVRHSGASEVVVELAASSECVTIAVEDHGRGVPPEAADRLFERFYRVDAAREMSTGGSGLGLAIVRQIARLHGGDAAYATVRPHGSRFTLALPQRRP